MIKAIQIICSPGITWGKIGVAQQGFLRVFLLFLLPLAIVTTALESCALVRWGRKGGEFDRVSLISQEVALRYGAAQAALLLASVVAGGALLLVVVRSFHQRASYLQCFTVMAYGFAPIFLARLLDAIPALHTWIAWAIGAVISLSIQYHGVGLLLKPDQTKGFALFLVSGLITFFTSGLSHAVALAILRAPVR